MANLGEESIRQLALGEMGIKSAALGDETVYERPGGWFFLKLSTEKES